MSVQIFDQLLQFPDPDPSVGRIGRIGTFGCIEVLRIVSPVLFQKWKFFIHTLEIDYSKNVYMRNFQVF